MSLPIITTIQTNINNLKSTKTDIKNAVNTDYDFIANEQIESYPSLIKQGIAYYKNRVPHATKEGTDLSFNAVPLKFENMTIKGNTEQASYTGKNLLKLTDGTYSNSDVTATVSNGVITLNGTATANAFIRFSADEYNIISGTYTLSANNNVALTSSDYLRFVNANGTVKGNQCSLESINAVRTSTFSEDTESLYLQVRIASGTVLNNVMLKPQLEEGSTATDWEQYVGGVPSPNPDYPQDIHVVTGENTVGVTGKNEISLLENLRTISSSATSSNIEANSFKMSGKGTWGSKSFLYDNTKTNQNYTISTRYTSTFSIPIRLTVYGTDVLEYTTNDLTTINQSATINTTANVPLDLSVQFNSGNYKYIVYRFWNNSSNAVLETNSDVLVDNIQLEKGSTATSYEPYYHQDYPVNLGSIELCKIGDYQDYLYKENGNWYKHGAIGKVVLDGTEKNINYQSTYQRINIPFNLQTQDWSLLALTLCNYYTMGNTETVDGSFNITRTTLMFKNNSLNSLNEWKTWLSTHNTSVYYVLDTPIITQITDTTLISQLNAIDKAKGNNGTTIITTTGDDLAPILNFTAYLKEVE